MISRLRISALVLMLTIAIAILPGCGTSKSQEKSKEQSAGQKPAQQYNIRLGHVFPAEHATNKAALKFSELVAQKTNNQVKISVYPASQLGGDPALGEALQRGTLEMAIINQPALSGTDKRLEIGNLLYLVDNYKAADKLFYGDGIIAQETKKILDDIGIHPLEFVENDFRHITNSRRPITKIEDIKGLKLRIPPVEMWKKYFTNIGALPTPIDFSELYTALQQKTIDGQDNGVLLTHSSKFYEVQKYMTLTYHMYTSAGICVSKKYWDSLPVEIQKAMQEAAVEVSKYQRELNRSNIQKQLDDMKNKGVQITELKPEEMAKFRAAGIALWKELEPVIGKDKLDKVLQAANEAGK